MSPQKKIVDLIYIDPPETEEQLAVNFRAKIKFWVEELEKASTNYLEQNFDIGSDESLEFMEVVNMKQFITHFIEKRLDWIMNSVKDPVLRRRYLTLLPPFPHPAGVKRLLIHFFQAAETRDKKGIKVALKNDLEKESTILWDVYKLLKTVESAETILTNLNSEDPFPSIFPLDYRIKCISSTNVASSILFRKFIRPEKQPLFSSGMPKSIFSPEAILERKKNNDLFIEKDMMDNLKYRNFFFAFFYYPTVRAKIAGTSQEARFNFLDFELIKQEFLLDWVNRRLRDNPVKTAIYKKYMIGTQTVAELVEANPKKEIEILQKLPLKYFNDVMAQINENVEPELQTSVDSLSENFGEHAFFHKQFNRAMRFAKAPINRLKKWIFSNQKKEIKADIKALDELRDMLDEELKEYDHFEYHRLKKEEIDFPFFQTSTANFSRKLGQIRSSMDPRLYSNFSKSLKTTFSHISESALLKRRTPKHEWVLPYLIRDTSEEEPFVHLLLLGAEVKTSHLGTSYAIGKHQMNTHHFTCYFVYATDRKNDTLGEPVATRIAKGLKLIEYDSTNMEVQKLVADLTQKVLQQM